MVERWHTYLNARGEVVNHIAERDMTKTELAELAEMKKLEAEAARADAAANNFVGENPNPVVSEAPETPETDESAEEQPVVEEGEGEVALETSEVFETAEDLEVEASVETPAEVESALENTEAEPVVEEKKTSRKKKAESVPAAPEGSTSTDESES